MKARSVFALFQQAHEDLSFCEARAQRSAHVPNFVEYYNNERLIRPCPVECDVSSTRLNTGWPEPAYPFHETGEGHREGPLHARSPDKTLALVVATAEI
jgi:hypothetical protein